MNYSILTALMLISSNALADGYRIAANVLILTDWAQTRYIANSDNHYEKNQLLGRNPDSNSVNKHFIGSLILNNYIGEYIVPIDKKKYFYMGITMAESFVVARNYSLGVRLRF